MQNHDMSKIPDHWTPQQALTVYDFLSDLQQHIWDRYEKQLVPLIVADLQSDYHIDHSVEDLEDFEDDIPF